MRILILDSNVIFSAILNADNLMGRFIMGSAQYQVSLFAPDYLRVEIERYIPKLVSLSGMNKAEIRRIIGLLYAKITFIADHLIPFENYRNAVSFVRDIDMDDLVFVALSDYLEEDLWTGDKRLYEGLKSKGYTKVVTFQELREQYGLV